MPPQTQVRWSRIASVVVLVIGILFGLLTTQHHRSDDVDRRRALRRLRDGQRAEMVLVAVQRLRLFLGHDGRDSERDVRAVTSATLFSALSTSPTRSICFPSFSVISIVGCLLGTLLTKPEDDAVLKNFYKTVNPWGVLGADPRKSHARRSVVPAQSEFRRDCTNVAVGIVWQLCLTALPIYLVLRQWSWCGAIAAALVVTSVILQIQLV